MDVDSLKKWLLMLIIFGWSLTLFFAFVLPHDIQASTHITQQQRLNPEFSHVGGFFEHGFYLEITAPPQTEVYYTLDASDPNASSLKYSEPIWVDEKWIEATGDEVVIQNPGDGTIPTGPTYPISFIRTSSSKWESPRADIFAATIIKAVAIDIETFAQSDVITHSYFVNENMSEKYTFPVMSISTDIRHLYDYETGIQVPGIHYDPWVSEERNSNRTGNYFMRGEDWERPIYIEYFDAKGAHLLSQNAGIRIHGGLSRKYPIKSYRLYARNDYAEENYFNYPFFEDKDIDQYKRLILRGFGQAFEYTVMGEAAAHEVIKPLNLDIQYSQPVILFINGEYFGIRNIRDRFDRFYLETHYDLDPEDITILTGHAFYDEGSIRGQDHYQLMYQYITRLDLTKPGRLEHIETLMDIDNFIDYNIIQLFYANLDWPQNNILYWRKNVNYTKDAPYGHDGRWRWMVFDLDASFAASWGGYYPEINVFERLTGEGWRTGRMLISLMQNQQFKGRFIYRFLDLLDSVFEEERVLSIVEDMINLYRPEMQEHIDRYGFPTSYEQWETYTDRMVRFAENRPSHIRSQLESHYELGSSYQLDIQRDQSQGDVILNTLYMEDNLTSKTVKLYEFLPYQLKAEPKEGYQFVGWYNDLGQLISHKAEFKVSLNQNWSLEARFIEGEPIDTSGPLLSENVIIYGTLFILSVTLILSYLMYQNYIYQRFPFKKRHN